MWEENAARSSYHALSLSLQSDYRGITGIGPSLLDPAALGGTPLVCGDSHDDADSADADSVRNAVTEFLVDNMAKRTCVPRV